MKKFYFFCLVGGAGFIFDYLVFSVTNIFLNTYTSKIIGFICAAQLTYFMNKFITFSQCNAIYTAYIFGQVKGFLINMFIFTVIYSFTRNQNIGFLVAAGITVIFNFFYANFFAFKTKPEGY